MWEKIKSLRSLVFYKRVLVFACLITVASWAPSLLHSDVVRAAGVPTFLQGNAADTTSGSTVAQSFNSATTTGNFIAVYVVWDNTNSADITDNQGNTYAAAGTRTSWGSSWSAQMFYAKNITGGSTTVTAHFATSLSNFALIYIHEYSGVDRTNPLDATAQNTGTNSGTMDSGNLTTTQSGDLLFAGGASATQVLSAGTGYNDRFGDFGNRTEDKLAGAAGTYNATENNNSGDWVMSLAAFKADNSDSVAPTAPSNLSATSASLTAINLTWDASTDNVGVSGYNIYRDGTKVGSSATTSYQDTGLTGGVTYTYTVKAYDGANNESLASGSASAVPSAPDTTNPTAPTNLAATTFSATQVDLSWTAGSDNVAILNYRIYRNNSQVGTTTGTSYHDTKLVANTTYTYTVASVDTSGNISPTTIPASATTSAASSFSFPAGVSANKRYLLDESGHPWQMVADAPHQIIGSLVTQNDLDTYFSTRQTSGFNAAWIEVLANSYIWGNSDGRTADGILPFLKNLDGSNYVAGQPYVYDVSVSDTAHIGDMSTPNPAYFDRLEQIVQTAEAHGITVMLTPLDQGGWTNMLRANSQSQIAAYATYLGDRFKHYPNVIWQLGNDFQTWDDVPDDDVRMAVLSDAIRAAAPGQLQTIELDFTESGSLNDSRWASRIDFSAAYTYSPTYAQVFKEYNRNAMPVFMVEANYENENLNSVDYPTTNETLRRQEYWTMLAGGIGQVYGNRTIWTFSPGWQAALTSVPVAQYMYAANFFDQHKWYDLVPDQTHTFLTAGYGTYVDNDQTRDVLVSDYATAAITPDGTVGLAYVPTARTITVDLSKMAGSVTARWYDPSADTYTAIAGSPFANTSTVNLDIPGANADGDHDWLLVMEATAPTPPNNGGSNGGTNGGSTGGSSQTNTTSATSTASTNKHVAVTISPTTASDTSSDNTSTQATDGTPQTTETPSADTTTRPDKGSTTGGESPSTAQTQIGPIILWVSVLGGVLLLVGGLVFVALRMRRL